ncbi:hypothetical protein C5167_017889 [Papaver somniferum]|uniref:Uncharacterized protein n=1 Tax=Papaver somniferum TaxID=3469 RepID=A0A4Y7IP13_PAPSO|nr:hypothetical protein C5167_017889 [Papaver somniferum]
MKGYAQLVTAVDVVYMVYGKCMDGGFQSIFSINFLKLNKGTFPDSLQLFAVATQELLYDFDHITPVEAGETWMTQVHIIQK